MRILATPRPKKMALKMIVAIKIIFSSPLFVRKTKDSPPKILESPEPRLCKRILVINKSETTT